MGFINQQTFHGARGPRGPLAGGVFLAGQDGQALRVEVRVVTGDRAPQRLMVFSNPKKNIRKSDVKANKDHDPIWGFPKKGVPPVIHFCLRFSLYKPSIWGTPHLNYHFYL